MPLIFACGSRLTTCWEALPNSQIGKEANDTLRSCLCFGIAADNLVAQHSSKRDCLPSPFNPLASQSTARCASSLSQLPNALQHKSNVASIILVSLKCQQKWGIKSKRSREHVSRLQQDKEKMATPGRYENKHRDWNGTKRTDGSSTLGTHGQ